MGRGTTFDLSCRFKMAVTEEVLPVASFPEEVGTDHVSDHALRFSYRTNVQAFVLQKL